MKSRHRIWLLLLLMSIICAAFIFLYFQFSFTIRSRDDFQQLSTRTYDSFFVSMHSLGTYSAEDFLTYLNSDALLANYSPKNLKELSRYLDTALASGNQITSVFLSLDPAILWDSCRKNDSIFDTQLSTFLLSYSDSHPEISFEIFLSSPSLSHWLKLDEAKTATAIYAYRHLISDLSGHQNIQMFFAGDQYWLIANPDNYTDDPFVTNEVISQKLFLYTFCDDKFQISDATADAILASLQGLIQRERTTPTRYPDLSGCNIVYFGDSILAYVTGSYSVSGYVSGFSGAGALDCSIGGTPATVAFPEIVSRFLAGEEDIAHGNLSIQETLSSDKKLIFVLNYGLNDYFGRLPIDGDSPYDVDSYTGALRYGISELKSAFPDCIILLMAPTFTNMPPLEAESVSETAAPLTDYVNASISVAEEMGVYSLDNYHTLGLNEDTLELYTADHIHLNEYGRLVLATHIMDTLEKILQQE